MITLKDSVLLRLTESELLQVVEKALAHIDISALDNLRKRAPAVQLDCIIRGYVGEYAMLKWLHHYGIHVETTNQMMEDDQMDIDFLYKGLNFELKTSLIPDVDQTLEKAIARRDIKLIKRSAALKDLKGDIHLQIFFNQRTKAKDQWLGNQEIDIARKDARYWYHQIGVQHYVNATYFVAWMDKNTLLEELNELPKEKQTWSFPHSKRDFWKCKITEARRPVELLDFLKKLEIRR